MLTRKLTTSKRISSRSTKRLYGAVRGILSALTMQGEPVVDFCGNPSGQGIAAVATVAVTHSDVGKEIVLLFEDGDAARPLLIGVVRPPCPASPTLNVKMDGQTLALTAEQEICLRCGEASITLTRAGKVIIKGAYLLSRSSGPNRVQGGSVLLN